VPRLGRYELHAIDAGALRLDGGAMFGVVPKPLWEKSTPADEANRIAMCMRVLLLRGDGRTILVDTGAGDKVSDKMVSIYAFDPPHGRLLSSLASHGIAPEDVTDVIFTHLHFDHAGGAVTRDGDGYRPLFPRARHYVQREHLAWALKPSDRDRASFLPENFQPLSEAGLIDTVDGAVELFPDIHLLPVHGHTFAQQLVRVVGGERPLLFAADLVPMSAHVPAPWIMGYDLQPLVTLREKQQLLAEAARTGEVLIFEHDPFVEAATIEHGERGFVPQRRGTLDEVLSND